MKFILTLLVFLIADSAQSQQVGNTLKINSFSPMTAGEGMTVNIRGRGFSNVTRVQFGSQNAASFSILNDTSINAVVGKGATGFVYVETSNARDSLNGFLFGIPTITINKTKDSIQNFFAERGKYSITQSYLVSGNQIQNSIALVSSSYFEISRNTNTGFTQNLTISSINGRIDTTRIYVRFKADSAGTFSGSINHNSTGATSQNLTLSGKSNCDSIIYFLPSINTHSKDTTLCFKDSIVLSVTNGTGARYQWSNGDTTKTLNVKMTGSFIVRVGTGNGCFSLPSPLVKTNKNINPTPVISITGNTLISSIAPKYRWFFNNMLMPGSVNNSLVPNQSGLYAVETSNDSICWNRSNDFQVTTQMLPTLKINTFAPTSAGAGSTVTIRGRGFSNVNRVSFGSTNASTFSINSDTVIQAVVGNGSSGFVKVENTTSSDSLNGFNFGTAFIIITKTKDSVQLFESKSGEFSKNQSYRVGGWFLQNSLIVNAPNNFEVSRSPDTGYSRTISIIPQNGTIDSARIFVRFKSDSSGTFTGQISHSSSSATTKFLPVTGIANCDSLVSFIPVINNFQKDTSLCFKDSVTLSITNGNFKIYKWSNGDTSKTIVVKSSQNINLRAGSSLSCLSRPSATIKTIRNTNSTPSLAMSGNTLISTSAPRYRWLFNNSIVQGNVSNTLIPNKVGFYAVETSNDSICWDRSLDYPIILLSTPLVNDTLNVKIFPNPTSTGMFFVVATLKKVTNVVARVTVTDANGNILLQTNPFIFFGREIKIPISLTFKGTVFVRTDVNGDIVTQTAILQ